MNVKAVEPKGDKGAAIMVMEDGTRVWTPEIEKAKELVGKPIPNDWTQRTGDFGPQALPPKQGKGNMPAAFRNTKEGQAFEQQQMNRRTALMQSIEWVTQSEPRFEISDTLAIADNFYAWLQSSSAPLRTGADGGSARDAGGAPAPESSGEQNAPEREQVGGATEPRSEYGEGSGGSKPPACSHPNAKPSPRANLAAKGWMVCPDCDAPPWQKKEAEA